MSVVSLCLSEGALCWLVKNSAEHIGTENCKTKRWATPPYMQDGDFRLLHPGEPLFQTFSGETLSYRGKEPLYPFFINECAYYEKSIALSLARRRTVVLPPIRVQTEQEQQQQEQQKDEEEDSEEDQEIISEDEERGGEDQLE